MSNTSNKPKIYASAIGRRKESTAAVRFISGTGRILVNGRPAIDYFQKNPTAISRLSLPFSTVKVSKYNALVSAHGGGFTGQLDATVLAVSRALVQIKADYKLPLRKEGLLTRDSRTRQRRMVGTGGKARRQKQSPKR